MHKQLIVALSLIVAASHLSASQPGPTRESMAPPGMPSTRYCLRVEPNTGSRMETVQCRTREEWAELDVDVDLEWADNGVRLVPVRADISL